MSDDLLPTVFDWATETASYLQKLVPSELRTPVVGIICGSGLSGLANSIRHDEPRAEVAYVDIPHFPRVTGMGNSFERLMIIYGNLLFSYPLIEVVTA